MTRNNLSPASCSQLKLTREREAPEIDIPKFDDISHANHRNTASAEASISPLATSP